MLTSRHWPSGAQFLSDLHNAMAFASSLAAPKKVGKTVGSLNGKPNVKSNGEAIPFVDVTMPLPPGGSAHARLPAQHFFAHARERIDAFLREGMALPGLAAQGRMPMFSMEAEGGAGTPGRLSGFLMLTGVGVKTPDHIYQSREIPLAHFGKHLPFESVAQNFLDTVDLLCTHTPQPTAPVWTAVDMQGDHGQKMVLMQGGFRADTARQARAILPAVMWSWSPVLERYVLFQADAATAGIAMPKPLRLRA